MWTRRVVRFDRFWWQIRGTNQPMDKSGQFGRFISLAIPDIGLAVRVFANGPGDLGSIPGRVIPKTQKMVLDASLLNTQQYKVRIKGKVEPSREGVAPSPTSWCSSYRKGSLRVTLDYGRQLFTLFHWRLGRVFANGPGDGG